MYDSSHNTLIDKDILTYLVDCQARNLSPKTTDIYQIELRLLVEYLGGRWITNEVCALLAST